MMLSILEQQKCECLQKSMNYAASDVRLSLYTSGYPSLRPSGRPQGNRFSRQRQEAGKTGIIPSGAFESSPVEALMPEMSPLVQRNSKCDCTGFLPESPPSPARLCDTNQLCRLPTCNKLLKKLLDF
jgi:hypothetical protein